MFSLTKKVIFLVLLFIFVGLVSAGVFFVRWSAEEIVFADGPNIVLSKGMTFEQILRALKEQGIAIDPYLLQLLAKLKGVDRNLKAGTYEFPFKFSPSELLDILSEGKAKLYEFRIHEGWTYRQLKEGLGAHPHINFTLADKAEREVIKVLGLNLYSLEGAFFPDTYFFEAETKDLVLLARAHETMESKLSRIWKGYDPQGYRVNSLMELLVLASLIEKETGLDRDRPLISQVFHRRLMKKIRLQTDPSVIFALGEEFDGDLRRKDLRLESPFNTYRNKGLPPGPISYPSEASLAAAANPSLTEYLYFVARGDGSSEFSKTLRQHNQAVRKYQLRQ